MPILRNPKVTSVEVVEMYQDVVDLVVPALRGKVPEAKDKLKVIVADVLTWQPPQNKKWDTIYFDIWPTIADRNLEEINMLHRRFARRKPKDGWMSSWQVDRIRSTRRRERDVYSY